MKTAVILFVLPALTTVAAAEPTAEALYTEGQAAYDRADYRAATEYWRASYQLSGENDLLFNLAQALRREGDCVNALSTYSQFLAADTNPTSEQHRLAEDLSRELRSSCTLKKTLPPRADSSALSQMKSDRTPRQTLRIIGLASGGSGVALLTAGFLVGHHAHVLGDEVTTACAAGCDWAPQKNKDAAGQRAAAIGYALDALGVAAIAGGALMYYLGRREREVTFLPLTHERGAIVAWSRPW